jgi:DNA-binding phage protein
MENRYPLTSYMDNRFKVALSGDGNPSFATILVVICALGLKFHLGFDTNNRLFITS